MNIKAIISIITRLYKNYIVLICILCSSLEAFAQVKFINAQEFIHDTTKKMVAQIGSKSQSRISFGSYGIKEVVGDSNKYTLIHDHIGGNVFMLPKVKVGETINITLISGSNKAQDLSLEVKDQEGEVIIIKEKLPSEIDNGAISSQQAKAAYLKEQQLKEGVNLLKAMISSKTSKYDITYYQQKPKCKKCKSSILVPQNPELSIEGLNISVVKSYGYKLHGIKGMVLLIQNPTKKNIGISEDIVSKLFKNTILTSLPNNIVAPKDFVEAFVVIRAKEEEI